MKYKEFYIEDNNGKSNCVIRSFAKLYNMKYEEVESELMGIALEHNLNFNDIEVFESFMRRRDTTIVNYGKDIKVKDLELDSGNYIVFCYDKKDFYHMACIIDNVLYDKNSDSLDLYTISVYKEKVKTKKKES